MGIDFCFSFFSIFDPIFYPHKCRTMKQLKNESYKFWFTFYTSLESLKSMSYSEISHVKDDVLVIFVAHKVLIKYLA